MAGLIMPWAAGMLSKKVYPVNMTYDNWYDRGSGSSTSFTASYGTAAPNRNVFITVHLRDEPTVSSVSIGGISAAELVSTSGGLHYAGIWQANVPTGTSGTVSVVLPGPANDFGVGVYHCYGGSILASSSAVNTSPANLNINVKNKGAVLGCTMAINGFDPSWTGATKDFSKDMNSGEWASVAHANITSDETPRTISVSGGSQLFSAAISWRA